MSECYCDYEPAQFYCADMRAARKQHRCDECRKPIAVGERYEYVAAKWDGNMTGYRTCPRCLAVREYVNAHVPCFCWNHSGMLDIALETMRQYACEVPGMWMEFGRLYVSAVGLSAPNRVHK